jgi:hypothetical protein
MCCKRDEDFKSMKYQLFERMAWRLLIDNDEGSKFSPIMDGGPTNSLIFNRKGKK